MTAIRCNVSDFESQNSIFQQRDRSPGLGRRSPKFVSRPRAREKADEVGEGLFASKSVPGSAVKK